MPNDETNEEDHPHESVGGADIVGGMAGYAGFDEAQPQGCWVDKTWLGASWSGSSAPDPSVHQQPGTDPDSDAPAERSPDTDNEGYYDAGGYYHDSPTRVLARCPSAHAGICADSHCPCRYI